MNSEVSFAEILAQKISEKAPSTPDFQSDLQPRCMGYLLYSLKKGFNFKIPKTPTYEKTKRPQRPTHQENIQKKKEPEISLTSEEEACLIVLNRFGAELSADHLSLKSLKKSYRKLVKKYHPDISSQDSHEVFLDICESYQTLIKPFRPRSSQD